jgi:magnesium transporter
MGDIKITTDSVIFPEPGRLSPDKVKDFIENRNYFELKRVLADSLAADIVETINSLELSEQVLVFRLLDKDMAAEVFSLLDHDAQEDLLGSFGKDRMKAIIEEMDPDDLTELFDELPDKVVRQLVRLLPPAERSMVSRLMGYPEESAGRLMTPEFIKLRQTLTVEESIAKIRHIGIDKETIYYSYVIDEKGMLIGIVSLRDLLLASPEKRIEEIMTTNYVFAYTHDDQEKVAGLLAKYDINALPVVDHDRRLVGIITIDDVVDVITEEATEDMHKMAGMEAPEDPYFSTGFLTLGRKRALWLIVLLVLSYLSSVVLKHYSDVLQILVPLAFFIPMLTGTCGNTGMQSATLIIRGLATGEIELGDFLKILLREIFMGLFLGIILGLFSFIRARFVDVNPFIGIAVGIAVFVSVLAANMIGATLPLLLKKLKIDPAVSAGPFITTIIDVTSLILYFEIARIIFDLR